MNSFGRLFRLSIWGESHGEAVGVLIDGCPAGLPLAPDDFEPDLARRRPGRAGTTARRESDPVRLISGVFQGKTTGAPLLIHLANQAADSSPYEEMKDTPRPGHADLSARIKFGGFQDYRGGGHFSGRLTAGLVAAGTVAKKLLPGVSFHAEILEIGGRRDYEELLAQAIAAGDSLGGLVECRLAGLPAGLGEPFFDSVESLIGHLAFAVPAVKGVEFGDGFAGAGRRGSEYNDPILAADGRAASNHAGGVNGGLTNGNEVVFRVAVRPTASIATPQPTIDLATGRPAELTITGHHDACIALRFPVILEAVGAIVLADLLLLEQRIPRVWR
ncbi:MAG: chorismate synthase [Myxococcales bacterium]|nr:chorismate synthase [Myxococcales bacterium]